MSTRAMIARSNGDGTLTAVYLHSDGYPSHAGNVLLHHYTDPAKLDALLALGDLSILGPELGEAHNFNEAYAVWSDKGWTTAYKRDRGEHDVDATTFDDMHALERYAFDGDIEWLYACFGGHWYARSRRGEPRPLADILAESNLDNDPA